MRTKDLIAGPTWLLLVTVMGYVVFLKPILIVYLHSRLCLPVKVFSCHFLHGQRKTLWVSLWCQITRVSIVTKSLKSLGIEQIQFWGPHHRLLVKYVVIVAALIVLASMFWRLDISIWLPLFCSFGARSDHIWTRRWRAKLSAKARILHL